jgi:hypothetical protein
MTVEQIVQIADICLPAVIRPPKTAVVKGWEALCILLNMLSNPCTVDSLVSRYCISAGGISTAASEARRLLLAHQHDRLVLNPIPMQGRFPEFAEAVVAANGLIPNVAFFHDVTARKTCKPKAPVRGQIPLNMNAADLDTLFFDGQRNHRFHAWNHFAVGTVLGLIVGGMAPGEQTPGSCNDINTMMMSNMAAVAPQFVDLAGVLYCSFGDAGFNYIWPHMLRMWLPPLAALQALSNASMTRVRTMAIEV